MDVIDLIDQVDGIMERQFWCPECGGRKTCVGREVETLFRESDPWSAVLRMWQCAGCGAVVPAHLAERWDGISEERARQEWREVYRATQPKWE